jgi:predicted MFS family arabinose efflux permease
MRSAATRQWHTRRAAERCVSVSTAWVESGIERPDIVLVIGLLVFGFVFAVISSAHSYLILAYAGSEKAAEDVGFYYAANAAGRLIGILLSGVLTQAGGMQACLWGSAIMLALCLAITFMLPTGVAAKRVPA